MVCGFFAHGQTQDLTQWRSGYSTIESAWRFQAGDNLDWARTDFDDSHWQLLELNKSWAEQGYKNYSGFAWYRIQLRLPSSPSSLALLLYPPATSAEVFVDGRLAETVGQLRPTPEWRARAPIPVVIALPGGPEARTAELALRVWEWPLRASTTGAGSAAALPVVGSRQAIEELHALAFRGFVMQQLPDVLPFIVSTVTALFSLALFLVRFQAKEYLWGALWLLCGPAGMTVNMLRLYQHWPTPVSALILVSIHALGLAFFLLFIWQFVGSLDEWKLKTGIALTFFLPLGVVLVMQGVIPVAADYLGSGAVELTLVILLFIHLLRLAFRHNRDAQIFLVPFVLYTGMGVLDDLRGALYFLGIIRPLDPNSDSFAVYHTAIFNVTGQQFFSLLSYLTLAVVLALRFARSAREEERLTTELQSARQVQAHLVPAALAPTSHLRFDAAYLAASEVGGDFYQVFPSDDGSALIAVGDVSGKGLHAAMFATLVVGALRSLARLELPPSKILCELNEQLHDPEAGRFVTCLVLRVSARGLLAIANAGHLPPYLNGREIDVNSGLPLGISLACEYLETEVALGPGDAITLLSDGIVEAQNSNGELFGFERTCAISMQPAAAIAETARAFGQQDDITVLKVSFDPVPRLEAEAPRPLIAPRPTGENPHARPIPGA